LIRDVIKEIDQETGERIKFQRIHLVMLLLDYYEAKLEQRVNAAVNAAIALRKGCHTRVDNMRNKLEIVLDSYNVYCTGKQYVAEDMVEILNLSRSLDTIDETFEATFTIDELQDLYREFKWDDFHFSRPDSMAHFFSLKFAKLEKLHSDLSSKVDTLKSLCDTTQKFIDSTEDSRKDIQRDLSRYAIPAKFKVSSKLIDLLQQYQSKPAQAQSAIPKIKMSVVKEFFSSLEKQLSKDKATVQQILVKVENLRKAEKEFLGTDRIKLLTSARKFFTGHFENELANIENKINKATKTYSSLSDVIKGQKVTSLDDLSHVTGIAEKKFREVITPSMFNAEEDLTSLFEDAKTTLTKIKTEVKNFLEIVRKGLGESVGKLCHEYSEYFAFEVDITLGALKTVEEGGDTEYKWTQRLTMFDQLRTKLFKDLKPILPPDEGEVLLEIVRILEEKRKTWVDMPMLISEIGERMDRSEDEIVLLVKELAKINLLREGASLPI